MPDTTQGITYPASTSHSRLWEHFQEMATDTDAVIAKRGIKTAPTIASSDGTSTSGTTETRDAVLGNYVFTAEANRRYRAKLTIERLGSSVVDDLYTVRIRDGGVSTPTAASTLLAQAAKLVNLVGGIGEESLTVEATFTATAGTHTLSAFIIRSNGSGTGSMRGTRQLYVEDIGPA